MFKHILIPTDGSRLAGKGIKTGVKLAKALGARVTGVYVAAPYTPPMYDESAMYLGNLSQKDYQQAVMRQSKKALAGLESAAAAAKVPCKVEMQTDPLPWRAILRAASVRKCDAIAMASHGRSGLGGLILGSETARVLAHSKIPVLVAR